MVTHWMSAVLDSFVIANIEKFILYNIEFRKVGMPEKPSSISGEFWRSSKITTCIRSISISGPFGALYRLLSDSIRVRQ